MTKYYGNTREKESNFAWNIEKVFSEEVTFYLGFEKLDSFPDKVETDIPSIKALKTSRSGQAEVFREFAVSSM